MKLQSVHKSKAGPLARVTFRKRMWEAVTCLLLLAFVAVPVSADGDLPTWPSNPDWQSLVPGRDHALPRQRHQPRGAPGWRQRRCDAHHATWRP